MKLSELQINPKNPRVINEDKFRKLCESIKNFPKMMELRPIVIDDENIVIGGNMRVKALDELGFNEIPDEWVKKASELTEEEKKQFIITDNNSFGSWDWDLLSGDDWDSSLLEGWGIDLPSSWKTEDLEVSNQNPPEEKMFAIAVVAYDDLNDLDKITELYELDSIDITDDIKNKVLTSKKVYVFRK